ncbi:kinase-like domain-containing protein [Xylaria curta]|nr:kinase-like domain-containing protein [Xylaria curta]
MHSDHPLLTLSLPHFSTTIIFHFSRNTKESSLFSSPPRLYCPCLGRFHTRVANMFLPKRTARRLHLPPSSPEPLLSGLSSPRLSLPKRLRAIFSRLLCLPSKSSLKTSPEPLSPKISLPNNSRPEVSQNFPQPVLLTLPPPPPVLLPLPESPHILSSPSEAHDIHPRFEDSSPLLPWKPRMDDPCIISKQFGAEVRLDDGKILKTGSRVSPAEEAALRMVKQYTTIPVPDVYKSDYADVDDQPWGKIWMEHLQGSSLSETWDNLDDAAKERICRELWGFVEQLRSIPKPPELERFYQCGADGSVSQDVLLDNLGFPVPLLDDKSLRNRINERYIHFGGASYRENLLDYLPQSNVSVFTHNDLAPRNVLIDEAGKITGLVDWELAGWYPDYWEYAKTQLQWKTNDFMGWMDRTRPQDWNIAGIHKAARILF